MGVKERSPRGLLIESVYVASKKTHLRFQLWVFRFQSIPIDFEFLRFRFERMHFIVGDFQLFFGSMDVQQWCDTYEKAPPRPVADLHKCSDIPLNASHGQFLGKGLETEVN